MRIIRPFLLLPGGGQPAVGGGEDTASVVKDFRPANTMPRKSAPEVEEASDAPVPKAPATQDSSATGSASDSSGGDNENKKPDTETTPSNPSSESSASPADAEKVRLLHPSAPKPDGSNEPPAGE